ncbi:Maf1 regulator-domain-containing protein [Cokeromyces recurvatus]|uniref:Maf1 regulator-domain-containing protein n=1 Tax=Cokeromyces recurvatus TaxID=90255 RepID=UPI002220843C|nr:Maf1 regulator-domain-containing protein [Cokeromyces recurvatus]KAI7905890.1 Maf1 regulator-domain-containing protein [Cokeromyces recurvatus]
MKFLEVDSLDLINTAFLWETSECVLTGRVEAYSCKSAGTDKKLFKTLENRYNTELLAPGSISPDDLQIISPFGRLTESAPRKTFFYLLATLNAAFPEHDFEDVRPDQFLKLPSFEMVMNSVNTTLFNLGNDVIVNKYRLWDVLDEIVQLNECDVYTYTPDVDDDPMNEEEGYLWSVNYFFFNRKLKRMIFFSIKSESLNGPTAEAIEEEGIDAIDDDNINSRRYHDDFLMDDLD